MARQKQTAEEILEAMEIGGTYTVVAEITNGPGAQGLEHGMHVFLPVCGRVAVVFTTKEGNRINLVLDGIEWADDDGKLIKLKGHGTHGNARRDRYTGYYHIPSRTGRIAIWEQGEEQPPEWQI